MHVEILVEDVSGKRMLDELLPSILSDSDTYRVHSYKGIGHLPSDMRDAADPRKRILLKNLPRLLKGYGRTFRGYPSGYEAAVVIVCDLDDRDRTTFLGELQAVLGQCNPRPRTEFCFAIEEGEAWLLGDLNAVRKAYPDSDNTVLDQYVNDSVCGTWEVLADAVYPGGSLALTKKGWQALGAEKFRWAKKISPHMDVEENASPSFRLFRDSIRGLLATCSHTQCGVAGSVSASQHASIDSDGITHSSEAKR